MNTKILKVDPHHFDIEDLAPASWALAHGNLVIFPTETVYGLGANALDEAAVRRIFAAKGRPSDNPLIVHIAQKEQVFQLAEEVSSEALLLMDEFWGGPLTIILKKKRTVPDAVTAGGDTVGIRLPSHPVANALLSFGVPVAAPSANLSGKPSPTCAKHCIRDMDGRVEMIIDGGNADYGIESTVIDMSGAVPTILRPGAVTLEMIRAFLPTAVYGGGSEVGVPKSPGMKYRHYAPQAPMTVLKNATDARLRQMASGARVGILSYRGIGGGISSYTIDMGADERTYGARLFYALRRMDEWNVTQILAVAPSEEGYGAAVTNRLYKAAGGNVL